jgi:hypothetical protein
LYRIVSGQLVPGSRTYLPSVEVQDVLMQSRVYRWVADHSQLYALVRERIAGAVKGLLIAVNSFRIEPGAMKTVSDESDEALDQYSIELSTALLRKSKQEIEQEGRDFVLVDILERRMNYVSSFGILPSNLRAEFNIILPLDAFRAAGSERKLYYERGHGHLTPDGVDILARLTAERVSKSPKLASCAAIGR